MILNNYNNPIMSPFGPLCATAPHDTFSRWITAFSNPVNSMISFTA